MGIFPLKATIGRAKRIPGQSTAKRKICAQIHDALIAVERRDVDRVTLLIPMPPSVNALTANRQEGGRHKTKVYKDWIKEAGQRLQIQHPGIVSGKYQLEIWFPRAPGKIKMDLGNREKALSDLLVKHYVVDDDSMAEKLIIQWHDDTDVRVLITKWEMLNERTLSSSQSVSG